MNVPVFRVVETLVPAPAGLRVARAFLALAVTLVLAKASWEWFEKPLVRLGHRAKYE
jgi:peptidoglycan/LPS O-acetylase OafA/YrhL